MTKDETSKLTQLQQILEDTQAYLQQASQVLRELGVQDVQHEEHTEKARTMGQLGVDKDTDSKIIEGVFDGQHMIGPDGKQYAVPANYASKSKLVEGDILKLTITSDGSFLYKQIGPVERKRLLGVLVKDDEKNDYRVLAEGRSYRVLLASVTYFKGEASDEAVILVPKDADSKWAAVENVVKNFSKSSEGGTAGGAGFGGAGAGMAAAGGMGVAGAMADHNNDKKLLDDGSDTTLTDGSDGELEDGSDGMLEDEGAEDETLPPEEQGTALEDLEL